VNCTIVQSAMHREAHVPAFWSKGALTLKRVKDQRIRRWEEPGNANFTRVKHWVKGAKRSLVYYTGDTDDKVVDRRWSGKGSVFGNAPVL
jgi:hypothetical protein